MITTLLGKALASMMLRKMMKAILFSVLTELVAKTDNKIDDKAVAAMKKALA